MSKLLIKCPLHSQELTTREGYQRAVAKVPNGSSILFLGASPPQDDIAIYAEVELKFDDKGEPLSLSNDGVVDFEFCILIPGQVVPEGYKYRAPVRASGGVIFVYEKITDTRGGSSLILPRGH